VDSQYPKIKINSPGETDFVGANFKIEGTASDDKEMDTITISATGMSDVVIKAVENWNTQLDVSTLQQGTNRFKVVIKDKSGKETTTEINLNVDKIGPYVNLLSPDATVIPIVTMGRINFNGTVSDDYQLNNNGKLRISKK